MYNFKIEASRNPTTGRIKIEPPLPPAHASIPSIATYHPDVLTGRSSYVDLDGSPKHTLVEFPLHEIEDGSKNQVVFDVACSIGEMITERGMEASIHDSVTIDTDTDDYWA